MKLLNGNFMGNSSVPPYLKVMAALLLAVTYMAILIFCGAYAIVHNWNVDALPGSVTFLLGMGMSVALNVLGIHTGASLADGQQHPAAPLPRPTTATSMTTTENGGTPNAGA